MICTSALERPWDEFQAYLFDIDGTLLNCTDAVHYFAFCDVLQRLSGRSLDLQGVTAHGNTDVGILRDALALSGMPENAWRSRLPEMREAMGRFVAERKQDLCVTALPKVHETLQHLRTKGAVLGVATGNLREIGRLKLERAGLLDYFQVGGWSDDHEYRVDVFRAAASMMRVATQANVSICFVGDTPADIRAAQQNDLPVIAVATGIYSVEQLAAESPSLYLKSLADLFPLS